MTFCHKCFAQDKFVHATNLKYTSMIHTTWYIAKSEFLSSNWSRPTPSSCSETRRRTTALYPPPPSFEQWADRHIYLDISSGRALHTLAWHGYMIKPTSTNLLNETPSPFALPWSFICRNCLEILNYSLYSFKIRAAFALPFKSFHDRGLSSLYWMSHCDFDHHTLLRQ